MTTSGPLGPIPVPLSGTVMGLVSFVALCVMERFAEPAPAVVGENWTVMGIDCPGVRLKAPPPVTIENGVVSVPTLPVNVAVEPA